jgi:alkylhydroperoxidase family enzyme
VLQFARCISRASPLATCRDGQPLLDAGYSSEAVREIAALAALYVFFNRLSTMPALPPSDFDFGERWWARLVRPFVSRLMHRQRGQAEHVSLAPTQRTGPFATTINALDGLPVAPRMREIVDEAWASPLLPQRTKALIFAVVARGIRCPLSERESTRLLIEDGMNPADVEAALAHLGPGLDERERAAVSLARESIWYRPSSLQRHALSVRGLFTRQAFVEMIGVAALANMLCRLGVGVELAADAR